MPLETTKKMLIDAYRNSYAVGAFNVNNMEMVQAVIDAAVEENAPVILQFSIGAIRYAGLSLISGMVKGAASQAHVPVALHFDHGATYNQNLACIKNGFTSLMYDGSLLPLETNILETSRICKEAHKKQIPVEAELGRVPHEGATSEEINNLLADPTQAKYFVEKTNVDSLAVAIGSVHAQCKQLTALDFERLQKINAEIPQTPLVLHGSSGVKDECITKSIKIGISKVNVGTCLIQCFTGALIENIQANPEEKDPRKHLAPARDALKDFVRKKIRLFGSNEKVTAIRKVEKFYFF